MVCCLYLWSPPPDDGRAPAEAGAEAGAGDHVALLDLAAAHGLVQGERDGARAGVAVLGEVGEDLRVRVCVCVCVCVREGGLSGMEPALVLPYSERLVRICARVCLTSVCVYRRVCLLACVVE